MNRRWFLGAGLSLAPALALSKAVQAAGSGTSPKLLLPPALQPGDTVGIVSPSGAVDGKEEIQFVQEVMEALGLKVKVGPHSAQRYGYLAGKDADRAADLNAMFADTNVKAIMCSRGGWGVARLLTQLDYALIRKNPKILLGYSDITALHCAIQARTGLITFHGPIGLSSWNPFVVDQFRRVFFERELVLYKNDLTAGDELVPRRNRTVTITSGKVQGTLVGGNLTVLTALAGSSYLPDFKGKILFLEDVSEAPYRIDRMFSTLKLMGVLDEIAGFVFGHCTDCKPENGYGSLTLATILEEYIKPLNIPAYSGAMIGHIREQFIVPVGGKVELDADAGTLRLLAPVFRA